ncbi:MAG TPA: NAD(P)/FAD-dependent oxidoreductase [Sphingomicrobium sp.]|nr:NAD(P)/FAD-dependent oxidoreductase [Sphingomicrobium sp.]
MIDLAIVGGGAAGIAAAREARERGLTCVILEASERIGGRACTVEWQGYALDLGATWLHSAGRNPLAALAEQIGFDIDRSPIPWRKQFKGLGFSEAEQARSWGAVEAFTDRLRTTPPANDRASDALEPRCEWNGFLQSLNGYLNGTSLENTSAADFMAYWDSSENSNWRLPSGYGGLVEALANGLDVRTGWAVRRVDWSTAGVHLSSDQGVIEAKRAIIAVPTNVLAAGAIVFAPQLNDRLHAAAQLPLGRVEKLFLALAGPESLPGQGHLVGNPRSAETGSYMLRPVGMPLVEGFFAGDWLDGLDADDLAAKTREELGHLLGADFARSLRPVAHSDWKRHAFIRGSYSFARPGQHGARAALRAAVDGPIAFAGEACSDGDYATVHGAWQSGREATAQLFGNVA